MEAEDTHTTELLIRSLARPDAVALTLNVKALEMRKLEFSNWNESIGIVFYIANPYNCFGRELSYIQSDCRVLRSVQQANCI